MQIKSKKFCQTLTLALGILIYNHVLFSATAETEVLFEKAKWADLAAQEKIGDLYLCGQGGLPNDNKQASVWYRKAALEGRPSAQYSLGIMYRTGYPNFPQDLVEAIKWFRMAADQNYSLAQFELGRLYELGAGGLAQDAVEAAKFYRKAADQGSDAAQYGMVRT